MHGPSSLRLAAFRRELYCADLHPHTHALRAWQGKDLIFGVRPEAFQLTGDAVGGIKLKTDLVENARSDTKRDSWAYSCGAALRARRCEPAKVATQTHNSSASCLIEDQVAVDELHRQGLVSDCDVGHRQDWYFRDLDEEGFQLFYPSDH